MIVYYANYLFHIIYYHGDASREFYHIVKEYQLCTRYNQHLILSLNNYSKKKLSVQNKTN